VKRLVLVRPAVEAGERLGFLPGDLAQKVDPYLRPLYDALYDLMGFDKTGKLFERGTIEVAPLAYMRGRTLNHSFIILDEAQNTTPEQMKMFLTRIGFGTKSVITGDVTQIDLARGRRAASSKRTGSWPTCAASRSRGSRAKTSFVTHWCRRSSAPTSATSRAGRECMEPAGPPQGRIPKRGARAYSRGETATRARRPVWSGIHDAPGTCSATALGARCRRRCGHRHDCASSASAKARR
jgi:hypothetical protein